MDRLLSEKEERDTLTWIDKIPFSRPKKNISRDFSDGVMVAEIVKHYFPRIVDIHNYITSCNTQQKLSNWNLLNNLTSNDQLSSWMSTGDDKMPKTGSFLKIVPFHSIMSYPFWLEHRYFGRNCYTASLEKLKPAD
uniref:Calponin-homology (CH) domain-containing protein n=1 Tax=Xiphophorus couchianus TaxID=32473 RepID=A0A3B5LVC4_9TELE